MKALRIALVFERIKERLTLESRPPALAEVILLDNTKGPIGDRLAFLRAEMIPDPARLPAVLRELAKINS